MVAAISRLSSLQPGAEIAATGEADLPDLAISTYPHKLSS